MKILLYLDDWLICALSRLQAAQDTSCLLSHVVKTTFVGVALNSVIMKACPSLQRINDILRLLLFFQGDRMLPYSQVLCLMCKLTALFPFNERLS